MGVGRRKGLAECDEAGKREPLRHMEEEREKRRDGFDAVKRDVLLRVLIELVFEEEDMLSVAHSGLCWLFQGGCFEGVFEVMLCACAQGLERLVVAPQHNHLARPEEVVE